MQVPPILSQFQRRARQSDAAHPKPYTLKLPSDSPPLGPAFLFSP